MTPCRAEPSTVVAECRQRRRRGAGLGGIAGQVASAGGAGGSPVHAGIDRNPGDVIEAGIRIGLRRDGSPVHAGIDRLRRTGTSS